MSFNELPTELYYEILSYINFTFGRSLNTQFKEISDNIQINNGYIIGNLKYKPWDHILSCCHNFTTVCIITINNRCKSIYWLDDYLNLKYYYTISFSSRDNLFVKEMIFPNPDIINHLLKTHPLYENKRFIYNSMVNSLEVHLSIVKEIFNDEIYQLYKEFYLNNKLKFILIN